MLVCEYLRDKDTPIPQEHLIEHMVILGHFGPSSCLCWSDSFMFHMHPQRCCQKALPSCWQHWCVFDRERIKCFLEVMRKIVFDAYWKSKMICFKVGQVKFLP